MTEAQAGPRSSSREVLAVALERLSGRVEKSGARVVPGALPMVRTPAADLANIFELLLSLLLRNARAVPEIWIAAAPRPRAWEFSMRDMAAGRLRLDEPSQAELARCRKLVELRDGRLWTDDGEELGTSIRFTVPG